MRFTIQHDPALGLLRVVVEGEFGPDVAQRILAELRAAMVRHPGTPILVDTRAAHVTLTATEVYGLGSDLQEQGVATTVRLAVVNEPQREFNRAAFLEEIGRNRGLMVRNFHDLDTALGWLSGASE
jgi:hypothetical protein